MEVWEHNGIKAKGYKPDLVGAYEEFDPGGCIVLGTSREAWRDLDKAKEIFHHKDHYHIIAVNDIAHQYRGPIQHICSLHWEIVEPMRQIRKLKMLEHVITHSVRPNPGVDVAWGPIAMSGGTSGMFGVKIALVVGYKKIIVAGVGIDDTGHYYDPEDHRSNGSGIFDNACRAPWLELHRDNPVARERVRVLSGTVKELYREPTRDWAYERVPA